MKFILKCVVATLVIRGTDFLINKAVDRYNTLKKEAEKLNDGEVAE